MGVRAHASGAPLPRVRSRGPGLISTLVVAVLAFVFLVANGRPLAVPPTAGASAWLLSLAHIEQAARTTPAHLAVHDSFVALYRAPRFVPRMHVWVEVHVAKHGEVDTEYVNCDPSTGLLPYFTVRDVSEED